MSKMCSLTRKASYFSAEQKKMLNFAGNVDYIFCVRYFDSATTKKVPKEGNLEVTKESIKCNLVNRQRSSQEILDFVKRGLFCGKKIMIKGCHNEDFPLLPLQT